ncbi:MAG: hypothetical protein HDT30_04770 [Clostridiales bacterium]|nr:hypothetical protein [Clostridiales bacterium]MDE7425040.1 hypothetical protein [Lachnospiraceae bacterium]
MYEYKKGHLVVSMAGHDKGTFYIINDVQGEYAFLVDGKYKTLEKPKKKKLKHIQFVADFCERLEEKPRNEMYKNVLKQYKKELETKGNSPL